LRSLAAGRRIHSDEDLRFGKSFTQSGDGGVVKIKSPFAGWEKNFGFGCVALCRSTSS
jgi:hypothetical protein